MNEYKHKELCCLYREKWIKNGFIGAALLQTVSSLQILDLIFNIVLCFSLWVEINVEINVEITIVTKW